jgi:thiosulfate reductase cytochrome b subunit
LYRKWGKINDAQLMEMVGKLLVWLLHTGTGFLMVIFLVVHLYLTTTGKTVLALIRAMVTGKLSEKKTDVNKP